MAPTKEKGRDKKKVGNEVTRGFFLIFAAIRYARFVGGIKIVVAEKQFER